MAQTRHTKEPTSVTVTPPAAPLPAPPDPPPPPPEEDRKKASCLLSLNFAVVRMTKELVYFRNQMRDAWELLDNFDDVPHLKEIMSALDPLVEELERKVKAEKLEVTPPPPPRSTQHIVTKSD